MAKLTEFLKDVKTELGRVSWPTKKQTYHYTTLVIGVSLGVAVFLGALDTVFSWLLMTFINN